MKQMTNLLSANIQLHLMDKISPNYEILEDFIMRDFNSDEFEYKLDYLLDLAPNLSVELKELEAYKLENLIYCRSHYISVNVGWCLSGRPAIDEDIVIELRDKYITFYKNVLKAFKVNSEEAVVLEMLFNVEGK